MSDFEHYRERLRAALDLDPKRANFFGSSRVSSSSQRFRVPRRGVRLRPTIPLYAGQQQDSEASRRSERLR